jgi:hypothetical protein
MSYDNPFSRDPVIRLWQIKQALAELRELGHIRQMGSTRKVARYPN